MSADHATVAEASESLRHFLRNAKRRLTDAEYALFLDAAFIDLETEISTIPAGTSEPT